jgi:hypothetical protein
VATLVALFDVAAERGGPAPLDRVITRRWAGESEPPAAAR